MTRKGTKFANRFGVVLKVVACLRASLHIYQPNKKRSIMKRLFFLVFLAMACQGNVAKAQGMCVFVTDKDALTNVRSAPKGDVVMTLPDTCSYIIGVIDFKDGWWRVNWIESAEESIYIELVGSPTNEYWIHHSVIGLGTRNYGGERWCLRATPSKKGKPTYWFKKEIVVHPLRVKGDWLQVTVNGHTGWIELDDLCSNPLTKCC